nr:increased DNA methylation 1-like [Ipomoea batatas]
MFLRRKLRSELNRLNFQGFYTVVSEKIDELIAVATVRPSGGGSGVSGPAPAPLVLAFKPTLPLCSAKATLDYSATGAEQKEDETFKCYQRRRTLQPVKAKLA